MNQHNKDEKFIDFKYLLFKLQNFINFLKKKYKILIICFVVMGILGFFKNKDKKIIYTSQISYTLDEKDGSSSAANPLSGFASQFGVASTNSGGGNIFSGSNLNALFRSRLIIEGILLSEISYENKKMTVIELYILLNNLRDKWKGNKELSNISFPIGISIDSLTITQNVVLNNIYNELSAPENLVLERKDKKNPFLLVEVNNSNEFFAKNFSEILLKQTSQLYTSIKVEKSLIEIELIKKQLDSARNSYNRTLDQFAKISDLGFNANQALKSKIKSPQLKQVDIQVNSSILAGLINSLEMSKNNAKKETPLFRIIDKSRYPLIKKEPKILYSILVYSFFGLFIGIFLLLAYFIYLETMYKSKLIEN
jgi:hypothetical protein